MTEPQIMKFVSRTSDPGDGHGPAYWFIFQGDKLLVQRAGHRATVPLTADINPLGLPLMRRIYLGFLREADGAQIHCYGAEIAGDAPVADGMIAEGLRQLYPQLDETLFSLAGRAIQIVAWDRMHQFCGQCGAPTETVATERAKLCPRCGLSSYPRLSPAIIIAVLRPTEAGTRLLLARNHRFPPGRYSVIAGFVEPGETLEECACREVLEEVGIQIKNVHYFGSQPWPFPNSLMIGFTAEYDSGEFDLEAAEIADAGWFTADALPGLPPKMSIARRLIDWFVAGDAGA